MIVYRHRRLSDDKVFYIGISKREDRPTSRYNRNKYWTNVVDKHSFYSEVIQQVDSWDEACELEALLIQEYGRLDLGTGCLVNMTSGGDGTINLIRTREHRDKIGLAHKGKVVSKKSRVNMSNCKNKRVNQFDLNGNILNTFKSTLEAEKITKVYNSNISAVCLNKRKTAGGFIWKYI